MNKRFLIKIWKDSVWSKIISVAILAAVTLTYNLLNSIINGMSFKMSFINFWAYKIDLWIPFLLITFFLIGHQFYTKRFKYDTDTLAVDRTLFNQIRSNHSMTDFFLDIKSNGFSSRPIRNERISTLINFILDSEKPDFEFINPHLNNLKSKLVKEFISFDLVLRDYIYGTNNSEWLSIPSEWEYDDPERMKQAIANIEKQENILTLTFQKFITTGRKILKV